MNCVRRWLHKINLLKNKIQSSGRVYFYKHRSADVSVKNKFIFGVKTLANISPDETESRLVLDKNSCLTVVSAAFGRGSRLKLAAGAKVDIGSETYLADNCFVAISTHLSIGNGCAISWDVQIYDDDGHDMGKSVKSAPIHIGNNVWIGSRATILKGVSLGDNCVVAAGAVVTKSFPAGTLIGGVPAKIIKENIHWS